MLGCFLAVFISIDLFSKFSLFIPFSCSNDSSFLQFLIQASISQILSKVTRTFIHKKKQGFSFFYFFENTILEPMGQKESHGSQRAIIQSVKPSVFVDQPVFCQRTIYSIIKMGNCVSERSRLPFSKTVLLKMKQILTSEEVFLLHLIFLDLAQRTVERSVTLENFLLFFHKNGFWGQQLFQKFDTEHNGSLSEEEFIKGIARISKSTQMDKINLLFKFFSRGKDNEGVYFNEFLIMLYNYPKQDLWGVLNDKEFVEFELRKQMILMDQRNKDGLSYNTYWLQSTNSIQILSNARISSRDIRLPSLIGRQVTKCVENRRKSNEAVLTYTQGSQICEIHTTNVQQLIKKFALRIFREAGVDPKLGKLTFNQFCSWVENHRALYQNYYEGFHHLVWEMDPVMHKPRYLLEPSDKSSQGRLIVGERKVPVQLILQRSLLVICENSSPQRALCIVCLDGLAVQRTYTAQDGFGLEISHRDGIYPEKRIFFKQEGLMLEWIDLLKFYRGDTIHQKYEIGDKIGTGKFSVVYHCRHLSEDRQYALKQITTFKLDPEARSLIAHQSSIMQVLCHPLLVQYKQCIQTRSHIYIITQLVQGKDLFEFVKQQEYLCEYDAAKIAQQIIVGVRYLHSFEIVHRDLKPQNIMVVMAEKEEVASIKIIDFGFSNYLSHLHNISSEEKMVGTPNYIAPQVLREEQLSFCIDNFAIGSILFFMLTGKLPFNDYTLPAILENTIRGDYSFPDCPVLSSESQDLVTRLLHNDPKQRISLDDALKHSWFSILKHPRVGRSIKQEKQRKLRLD